MAENDSDKRRERLKSLRAGTASAGAGGGKAGGRLARAIAKRRQEGQGEDAAPGGSPGGKRGGLRRMLKQRLDEGVKLDVDENSPAEELTKTIERIDERLGRMDKLTERIREQKRQVEEWLSAKS